MEYRQQLVEDYKQVLLPLLRYLPWLEKNAGKAASSNYTGSEVTEHSLAFPVYDGTLMNFVKDAAKTSLMDKNYNYVYVRNKIQSHDDERRIIKNAGLNEWNLLCGILSKYVMGGRTKGRLWSEAVQEGIFYLVLDQMKGIIEYWDKPINMENEQA
jgi:hypothetical protein